MTKESHEEKGLDACIQKEAETEVQPKEWDQT